MIDALIRFSLKNRVFILILSAFLFLYGSWIGLKTPVDVFPDLNRPRVTIITEAHGLAPEEVETLITLPLESALNGMPGVLGIRSSSGVGISIIYVNFKWGTDIYRNRQLVSERLQVAAEALPSDIQPVMGPMASIMGEIQFIGLLSKDPNFSPLDMREFADWVIRPRLMSIPGVSQVVVMGGGVKQYQILVSSERLLTKGISLEGFADAVSQISQNTTGGFINKGGKEFLIRPMARAIGLDDLKKTPIGYHFGKPVLLEDVAEIRIGAKEKRGEASINAKPAVVLTIQKQPDADTIALTRAIDTALGAIEKSLPEAVHIETDLFKQSNFINAAISNVLEALRDGSIMVALVLFIFLLNFRATAITLIAIPMSFAITFIMFYLLGLSINTMTLGGLAIAIGELVDDAIIDVENVFKRLRQNHESEQPKPILKVVYDASREIRSSVVISTAIVIAVFIPLFALSGLEGRLFSPMGLAYIISLTASLAVSLSLTPVLCFFLLPKAKALTKKEPRSVRLLRGSAETFIKKTIARPMVLSAVCLGLFVASLIMLFRMESNFLPHFNEGTATIGIASYPGIALAESNKLGNDVERAIMSVPEVKSTVRRTGRAEMDEHAEGVHWSEIDVDFKHPLTRDMQNILSDIREKILRIADVGVNLGQPIAHRIDHMMSGVRAQIAIKIFGPDNVELRRLAVHVEDILKNTEGLVDIQIEPLVKVPQVHVQVDRELAAEYGISPGQLAQDLEIGLRGEEVAKFIENQRIFDITVRLDETSRSSIEEIEKILVKTLPNGQPIYMADIASIYESMGPNLINRENLQRRLIISANSPDKALTEVIRQLKAEIEKSVELPEGYFIEFGGQYKSQIEATQKMLILGLISLLFIFLILYSHFKSSLIALQILTNVPLALIGSVFALWVADLDLSLATTVAFVTLCGIASRNGVLMIDRYIDLYRVNNFVFDSKIVVRGTSDRLLPIVMTAGTAILALIPLLLSKGEAGKEILHPVAVVIVGGLISSTLLNTFLTPSLFALYGASVLDSVKGKLFRNQDLLER
jgi:Cu(I)/Ag(I) efflux system membrane protein CusA/SilA